MLGLVLVEVGNLALLHPDRASAGAGLALDITNSQWWVQANQAGSHSTSTLLGASRISTRRPAPWWRRRARATPGSSSRAELLVHRIDLHIAYAHEGISGLLKDERHPELYFDCVGVESA